MGSPRSLAISSQSRFVCKDESSAEMIFVSMAEPSLEVDLPWRPIHESPSIGEGLLDTGIVAPMLKISRNKVKSMLINGKVHVRCKPESGDQIKGKVNKLNSWQVLVADEEQ